MKQQKKPTKIRIKCVLCSSLCLDCVPRKCLQHLLFSFKTSAAQCTHGVCAIRAAFSFIFAAFAVFENASCRMAINAHSWKLLSLFTQQHQQQHQRHLEMGKNLQQHTPKRNKLFPFFDCFFWASPAPFSAFFFFFFAPAAGVVFVVVNINELPARQHNK